MKNEKMKVMYEKEIELLASIRLDSNGKDYAIYTENNETNLGNVEVFVSEVKKTDNGIELLPVTDDNVWHEIREKISENLKGE